MIMSAGCRSFVFQVDLLLKALLSSVVIIAFPRFSIDSQLSVSPPLVALTLSSPNAQQTNPFDKSHCKTFQQSKNSFSQFGFSLFAGDKSWSGCNKCVKVRHKCVAAQLAHTSVSFEGGHLMRIRPKSRRYEIVKQLDCN